MYQNFEENKQFMDRELQADASFDIVSREILIGEKRAVFYFINGFCDEDFMQKIFQYLMGIQAADMPQKASELNKILPSVDINLSTDFNGIIKNILSGVFAIFIDGFDECVLIDARQYPARSVSEPSKDKVLRGSKDGFVETLIFNTALIRRRIRSTDLRMEILSAGKASKTDIALCYMDSRVDKNFLKKIRDRIKDIKVDALTLNQESLAECLYTSKWFNPFPKFKYTERPDTASAQILEGNIIILVDNSPSAMILPISIFDMIQEADDFYFPPVTGTYLRLSRFIILILTYFITPTFLLLMQNPDWIPSNFDFIMVKEDVNVPLVWQFLILELAIDGLRLAAVNTPSMLSTPLSVMAGLILGEFSVKSGWFNAEVMLYMAFVAIANYTHPGYELGYALKFFRIINLILTSIFQFWGYILGIVLFFTAIVTNKMVSGQSYLYPLIPFNFKKLGNFLFRKRLPDARE
ncbi:MAG: spore germination protein [Lachnospiraceae bacterium]|jgi:Bacillus/Clostridium GerA spore germination protein.|nr:spore germination protein [Lachnospiraceae bacterium]MCX4375414.1 spore germination protein [Lachnospiraceae bacterium]